MRAKNKQVFFAMHQIWHKIKNYKPDVEIEFHINWGFHKMGSQAVNNEAAQCEEEHKKDNKWENLINDHFGHCIVNYNREFLKDYVEKAYGFVDDGRFSRFDPIYLILLPHYLRRVKLFDYYLIYDDDILINYDFHDVVDAALEKKPVMITEPVNQACDKVLANQILKMYPDNGIQIYTERNPYQFGFNAGFQGVHLSIFDDFLSTDRFHRMLGLFNYNGILDANGKEIWGDERFHIDTQQQSFFGIMNTIRPPTEPLILAPIDYFVIPNFGAIENPKHGKMSREDGLDGWGLALKSKITHFIGHTQGQGKPVAFQDRMNMYLKEHGFLD